MKFFYITMTFFSFIFSIDNTYASMNYTSSNMNNTNQYESLQNNNFKNHTPQILHDFIDPYTYVIGPGDVFLFNMVTSNRVINLELITSPTGDILIPIIGTINIKGKILNDVYDMIINKCKDKYEDAYIYVNLIKIRSFKVLITGNFINAGMYSVSANYRVSDLIELIFSSNNYSNSDSLLYTKISNYPKQIMFSKDIFVSREEDVIDVDLFSYYINSNSNLNPYLQEGDVINFKNSKKIAVIGELDNPIRTNRSEKMNYKDFLEKANVNINNLSTLKILNYNMLENSSSIEVDRISNIDSEYRSDFDESFLSSRIRSQKGLIYINNKEALNKFLSLKVSDADILLIPQKIDYIEIIGAINKPGTYKLKNNFSISNYLKNAGGFSDNAKNKDIYIVDNISGVKIRVNQSYIPKEGDVIFIEEKLGYKDWKRFTESVKLAGTLSTMLASIINILWIMDRISN